MKIPLPEVSQEPDALAHPFPFQISMQTQDFLHGTLFHASFADVAAGEFVRLPGGVARVEELMRSQRLDPQALEMGWAALRKYQAVLKGTLFQAVLIALNSHWDWYIRRLVGFTRFARGHCPCKPLSTKDQKNLERAAWKPLREQITLIEIGAEVRIALEDEERAELGEMSLVRNLGLHNRWEVDATYLKESARTGYSESDLRIVDPKELFRWQSLLIRLLQSSSIEVAKRFKDAPKFGI